MEVEHQQKGVPRKKGRQVFLQLYCTLTSQQWHTKLQRQEFAKCMAHIGYFYFAMTNIGFEKFAMTRGSVKD
jgi:hypothetical protein